FTDAPQEGSRIPMKEAPYCAPGLFGDANGNVQTDLCKDPAVQGAERKKLSDAFELNCENFDNPNKPKPNLHGSCGGSKRDPLACIGRKRSEPIVKRQEKLQSKFSGKLVKSHDIGQSARELCESENSVGPNFYSYHEKLFCDMENKKLYPLCEKDGDVGCFDE
ncbi:hypothetical protein BU23DRAFT_456869, partial [Bimuria novae-zelandiae CBS 107.79]